MTLEEKRAVASLQTVAGYWVLIDKVVKSNRDLALDKLKLAKGQEEKFELATEFVVWDKVVEDLKRFPGEMVEELKQEGDEIYG